MILDDVFEKKDDIAIAVKGELNDAMKNYGFDIIKTLVTDIDPDAQVKESMNRINASEREKVAAQFEGDAHHFGVRRIALSIYCSVQYAYGRSNIMG